MAQVNLNDHTILMPWRGPLDFTAIFPQVRDAWIAAANIAPEDSDSFSLRVQSIDDYKIGGEVIASITIAVVDAPLVDHPLDVPPEEEP